MPDNTVTLIGNVVSDPSIRFTQGGAGVASFSIAVNRRWQNRQTQEWEEQVSYFDVTCWNTLAENVTESIVKGTRVIVVGRLEQQTWEDKNTGDKRSKIQIAADSVAPDLRWATAQVRRTESNSSSGRRGGHETASYDEEPF